MGDSDDGMVLNLAPYIPKIKKAKSIKKKVIEDGNLDDSINKPTLEVEKKAHSAKKRSYIDPKDFTPISSLFHKNPDIPKVGYLKATRNITENVLFSSENISDLPINVRLRNNLRDQFKFKTLTLIQMMAIPPILSGKDVMIKSPTGSGKTICYAVPILDQLIKLVPNISRQDGPHSMIIVPTRELAQQIFDIIQELCKSCISIVPGMLIGGEKCKSEKARLRKGINILIATPGRLLYHLKETTCLDVSKIGFLVLDEADKLFDMGFEKSIKEIIQIIDTKILRRQSVLLSATLSLDVKNLASVSLKNYLFVDSSKQVKDKQGKVTEEVEDVEEASQNTIPSSLKQYFVIVPAKLRLITLLSFITEKAFLKNTKVIVFVSNRNSVRFHFEAMKMFLEESEPKNSVIFIKNMHSLHGDMTQQERFKNFGLFKSSKFGVLICTDVASRGLDIKNVDWILQYSCPTQVEDYLHRIGRTARIGESGQSLLFLLPSEIEYLKILNESAVTLNEVKLFSILRDFVGLKFTCKKQYQIEKKVTELQNVIEEKFRKFKNLEGTAVAAYKTFVQSYAAYPSNVKNIFHVKHLHLGHLAKSFALRDAPNRFENQITIQSSSIKRKQKEDVEKKHIKETKQKRMEDMRDEIVSGPRTKKDMKKMLNTKKKKNIRI